MPPELKSKKRVKELIDRVKNKNLDNKNETKLTNTAEKQLEQANKGSKQKKDVLKKLEHSENQLKKTKQQNISLTDPESRWMMNKKNRMELS